MKWSRCWILWASVFKDPTQTDIDKTQKSYQSMTWVFLGFFCFFLFFSGFFKVFLANVYMYILLRPVCMYKEIVNCKWGHTGSCPQFSGEHGLGVVGVIIGIGWAEAGSGVPHSDRLWTAEAAENARGTLLEAVTQVAQRVLTSVSPLEVQITRRITLVGWKKQERN